uniref:Uncharacterized protein n=1 Tax=Arundo donax TaxID=35708 RepID=A0A0A8XVS7_ARUDO
MRIQTWLLASKCTHQCIYASIFSSVKKSV